MTTPTRKPRATFTDGQFTGLAFALLLVGQLAGWTCTVLTQRGVPTPAVVVLTVLLLLVGRAGADRYAAHLRRKAARKAAASRKSRTTT